MEQTVLESDWKTFRKRVPEWRERYLKTKNQQIVAILTDRDKTPTEQFWDTKKKMDEEARTLVDCLDGHSRSKMLYYHFLMYGRGLIRKEDLQEFSAGLRERILAWSRDLGA